MTRHNKSLMIQEIRNLQYDVALLNKSYQTVIIEGGGGGGDISSYYTKDELNALLDDKANVTGVFNRDETYDKNTIDGKLNTKANSDEVYTESDFNTEIERIPVKVSNLVWDTDTLRQNGTVLIGDASDATVKVTDSTTGTGKIVVGKIVVGSNDDGASNGVLIKSVNGVGEMKVNGKNVLVEDGQSVYNVSELVWDTETLEGKSNTVNISDKTSTLNVGYSTDTDATATGTLNIGCYDGGASNGTMIVGKGNESGNSTGKIVVGSNDDGASNGVLIKSTNGVGEMKVNGESVRVNGDIKVSNLVWDTDTLRQNGTGCYCKGN